MADYSLVQGDLEPDMQIKLGAPGAIAALPTALAVQMRWKKPDGSLATVDLVVVDAVAGIVKRVWTAGDSDQIGEHKGQVVVTAANSELVSDPNNSDKTPFFRWHVRPQLS